MIIFFHYITNFIYETFMKRQTLNSWSDLTISSETSQNHPLCERDAENDIRFDPPLYKQRYERVLDTISNPAWKSDMKKIVDFGCAEFGLFLFLKNSLICSEILFVDIDELLLKEHLFKIYPLNYDHVFARDNPLNLKVFAGSLSLPDQNLKKTDAVVGVEVIEHLYPDVLEALPYNVFGFIKPKIAIFTTPNSEFNVFFPQLQIENKFRHYDHKFEWTREQFQSWALHLIVRFPNYIVQFEGIGLGLSGTEPEGCCSQMAAFIRKDLICDSFAIIDDSTSCSCINNGACSYLQNCLCICKECVPKLSHGICTYNTKSLDLTNFNKDDGDEDENEVYYKLVTTIDYPVYVDSRSDEEREMDELVYRINVFGGANSQFWNDETDRAEIPFERLLNWNSDKIHFDEAKLEHLLSKLDYKIEECINHQTNNKEKHLIYEHEMANSEENDASGYESDKSIKSGIDEPQINDWEPESWDLDDPPTKSALALEVGASKKQVESLFDSGYQKSPTTADESPLAPPTAPPTPNKLSNILSVFDNFDKINESDVRRDKKMFNFSTNLPAKEVMKKICQEIAKHPVAGPSKEARRKGRKPAPSSDSEESADEVKSITTCLLENTLNRIEDGGEERRGEDIHELLLQAEQQVNEVPVAPPVVENGDLANNNRDREGNNYPPDPIDALGNFDNNNEAALEGVVEGEGEGEVVEGEAGAGVAEEVAWPSREALFDANSEVDLLEDFDMDGVPNDAVVIPVNIAPPVLPAEENGFPNWLLQIFEESEALMPEDGLHDEPHFYCQGDGLGVHPSTVDFDDEDEDDEGNESDTESTSDSSGSSSSSSSEYLNAESALDQSEEAHFNAAAQAALQMGLIGQAIMPQQFIGENPPPALPLPPQPSEVYVNRDDSDIVLPRNL